jgi:hypothetical protein
VAQQQVVVGTVEAMVEPRTAERRPWSMLAMIGLLGATAAARWSPSPTLLPPTTQRREEAETELLEAEVAARRFDTIERRVSLVWRSVFCLVTIALLVPLISGSASLATGLASHLGVRREERLPRPGSK